MNDIHTGCRAGEVRQLICGLCIRVQSSVCKIFVDGCMPMSTMLSICLQTCWETNKKKMKLWAENEGECCPRWWRWWICVRQFMQSKNFQKKHEESWRTRNVTVLLLPPSPFHFLEQVHFSSTNGLRYRTRKLVYINILRGKISKVAIQLSESKIRMVRRQ